jgi:lipopolysaccharide transport system ATP-binding protein
MPPAAITVDSLGKAYRIGLKEEVPDTLVGAATGWLKAPLRNLRNLRRLNTFTANHDDQPDLIWALRDVSFEVPEGEVLGVIGRNGAGKSTLLKILSRITEPTRGRAVIHGRVSSLLEVGTGFHQELSGRENIYMNGTILGMRKREIDRKLEQIIDFSGVEKFLDTPIKRYSSGMKVRLAFAVAAHLEPEILIIDEVLAVGDAEFQKKCLGKMHDVATGGRTVLFVSHNLAAVQSLCTRAIFLEQGTLTLDADVDTVISYYLSSFATKSDLTDFDERDRSGQGDVRFVNAYIADESGQRLESVVAGRPITFQLAYLSKTTHTSVDAVLTIYNEQGFATTHLSTRLDKSSFSVDVGTGSLICTIPDSPFPIGNYRVAIALQGDGVTFDHVPAAIHFAVTDSMFYSLRSTPPQRYCAVMLKHNWHQQPDSRPSDQHVPV